MVEKYIYLLARRNTVTLRTCDIVAESSNVLHLDFTWLPVCLPPPPHTHTYTHLGLSHFISDSLVYAAMSMYLWQSLSLSPVVLQPPILWREDPNSTRDRGAVQRARPSHHPGCEKQQTKGDTLSTCWLVAAGYTHT